MHILHKVALVALLVVSCVHSKSVTFKNCPDSKVSDVTEVDVEPCSSDPCQIKRGVSVAIKVTFKEVSNATDVQSKVYGYIAGVKVPFPLDNPDACTNCGLKCPLTGGTSYTFNSSLPVKTIYPAIKLVAQWELVDSKENEQFCFQVPLQLI
ncbi:NPC intracellular cholesterol transporter 2-like [Anneissia japonica]|uniref:NPC intracellular cholesterol transporter 2-like n=1 Tax=Anneissia japonica TaxID=1529436 RepID=UPI0014259136|nr:NPC intracellular cholesterol transporter 2-like [Anneissia japonica]